MSHTGARTNTARATMHSLSLSLSLTHTHTLSPSSRPSSESFLLSHTHSNTHTLACARWHVHTNHTHTHTHIHSLPTPHTHTDTYHTQFLTRDFSVTHTCTHLHTRAHARLRSGFNTSQTGHAPRADEGLGWGSVNKEGEGKKQFYFGDPSDYNMDEINGPRSQVARPCVCVCV